MQPNPDASSSPSPASTAPFAGQVILVTGATGGLGGTLARALAAAGATVVLHGRVVRKLEALFDELEAAGAPEPAILPMDFEKAGSAELAEAATAIERQLGRLDAIVHCAATLKRLAPLEHHPLEEWQATLRVNVAMPAALTRACLPLLRKSAAPRVVFVLDQRGHEPRAYWGAYGASKSGLEGLVRILADEWDAPPHPAVTGVIPGAVASPMRLKAYPGELPGSLPPVSSLVPLFLDLLGPDGDRYRGRIIDAAAALAVPPA